MLEVLVSMTMTSLLSITLIHGGVYLQRESKHAEQTLLVLQRLENELECLRVSTMSGNLIEPQWVNMNIPDLVVITSKSKHTSSSQIIGTRIEVSAHWTTPWGDSDSLVISTWVAFY